MPSSAPPTPPAVSCDRRPGTPTAQALWSKYSFWLVDRRDVKIDYYLLVVAADDHEVDGLAGVNVEFLMRHKRREVDKVSGAYFCRKLEPLSPAYLAPAFDDVDRQ